MEVDVYNGLPTVELTEVLGEIQRIILEEKKTPLLLDASEDRKLATFFGFKGVVIDGTRLSLPLRSKDRPKPKAWVEEARRRAVQAMKTGSTLAMDLGLADGSKAPIFAQW